VTVEGGGDAATARARQLLRVDDAIEAVAGDAAVLLRKAQLKQADGGGLLVELARKLSGLVPLGGVGLISRATNRRTVSRKAACSGV
jgi:hypothetical protein